MAYKFQLGAAEMSGSLTQEGALVVESSISGSTTIAGASVAVDGKVAGSELSSSANLNAGGNLVVAGTVKVSGVADAGVDVGADSVYFLDGDGFMKRETFSDYATALAGTSITAASGVLTVSDNGVTLAKMAGLARGSVIIGDASNDPSALAKGSAGQLMVSDGDDIVYRTMSGDATLAANGELAIANDAVEQAMIADDAVGADQLASDAVVNASIASGAAIDMDKLDGGSLAASLTDLADGDLMYAGDITDGNNLKSITFGNLEDAIFGNVSGDATIAAGGALTIGANAVEGSMLNDNVISGQTDLPSGIVGTDEFMISDAGVLKRVDLTVYGSFLAGNGITSTAGVLSLDSAGTPTGFGDAAATMVEGVNYGTVTLTADRIWTLPASPTVGDVVRIKAPAVMDNNKIVVTPSAGKTIDGQASVDLESPGAAIAVIYLTTDTWGIF